jgi:hypothetical protein
MAHQTKSPENRAFCLKFVGWLMGLEPTTIRITTCSTNTKSQAFLRDTQAHGLHMRVTNTGYKSFVFDAKREAAKAQEAAQEINVGEAWGMHIVERRTHGCELHYRDHIIKASPSGDLC